MDDAALTPDQRHRILVQWNDTGTDYRPDVCLHELVADQAARTPEATAVALDGEEITFGELERRANQLAHHLRRLGVGPEVRVGMFGERSPAVVVGLLGILKAGGAYVPFDPDDPAERVAFMLRDAGVEVLLTQERLLSSIPQGAANVVCLDRDWPVVAREAVDVPGVDVRASNLAYVIYTSGSTGKPKGAMNTHRNICNRLLWMQQRYRLTSDDRVLQKTPFSFDVSGWELFWPLIAGATMVMARPRGHRDPAYLAQLIQERDVSLAHFVPSMLRIFLDDPNASRCESLRQVICSGEELTLELQRLFFATLSADLDNLYGPTEAAIDVSFWRCDPADPGPRVPIGRPVANTQLYILDERLEPVPVGAVGELHIGGVQVGRGYLGRSELTAEKFIPDPFASRRDGSPDADARLYKTGDLACYREDGNIEFLGRIDHQVKIRGVRIELGEIDAAIITSPAVHSAVTVAREYGEGDKRLVAYVVARAAPASTRQGRDELLAEIQEHLRARLPAYMLPSAFVVLESLPLTASGKIDRKALPAPERASRGATPADGAGRRALGGGRRFAGTALERHLHELWCGALKLDHIGLDQQFFELGGNSLLAAQVINGVQRKLGEQVFVVALFEAPTIAELARLLTEQYAEAVAREFGGSGARRSAAPGRASGNGENEDRRRPAAPPRAIEERDLDHVAELMPSLATAAVPTPAAVRNPPAIFILSTHRSGTTLLRVMLAGHPGLFAASELQLLGFATMAERRRAFQGTASLWLEGAIRAVMEIHHCDADTARRKIAAYEGDAAGATTQEFFGVLQEWIAPRILVDKSPTYALDPTALMRAEAIFDGALYIHLVRHPYAMVRSAEDFHMDQIWMLREHGYSRRQLAELIWGASHRNILSFLSEVPQARQFRIRFEDLTARPLDTMTALCGRFHIPFHDELLEPYENKQRKMLDGVHPESMPMGDTRFHGYQGIDASVADKWQPAAGDDGLADVTWRIAERLGYRRRGRDHVPAHALAAQRARRRQHRNTP